MYNFEINNQKIEKASSLLKAVAHPLRFKIIKLILDKKEVNVNVIYNTLNLEQSVTSQHLKILRGVDVVHTRKEGKKIYYSLNYYRLTAMNHGIDLFQEGTQVRKTARKNIDK